MNYLAHTLLSTTAIDFQLANLAADALKSRPWSGCSQQHRQGLLMHRRIDSFTDSSPYVQQAKSRLGRGYLKGVVVDILFDHFLSQHWAQFVRCDFDTFISDFYQAARQQAQHLPPAGQAFIARVVRYDFLHLYGDFSVLPKVLGKFDRRLSPRLRKRESASDYLPALTANYAALEQDFLVFFPTLITLFLVHSQAEPDKHYFF
ncbi:MAG: hypothetical protein CR975_04860 [Gammaproteobacteria bacterium]|nr:MAG: hypothetical protein CR975_04860 [Gammaproteobacteria bacterium]